MIEQAGWRSRLWRMMRHVVQLDPFRKLLTPQDHVTAKAYAAEILAEHRGRWSKVFFGQRAFGRANVLLYRFIMHAWAAMPLPSNNFVRPAIFADEKTSALAYYDVYSGTIGFNLAHLAQDSLHPLTDQWRMLIGADRGQQYYRDHWPVTSSYQITVRDKWDTAGQHEGDHVRFWHLPLVRAKKGTVFYLAQPEERVARLHGIEFYETTGLGSPGLVRQLRMETALGRPQGNRERWKKHYQVAIGPSADAFAMQRDAMTDQETIQALSEQLYRSYESGAQMMLEVLSTYAGQTVTVSIPAIGETSIRHIAELMVRQKDSQAQAVDRGYVTRMNNYSRTTGLVAAVEAQAATVFDIELRTLLRSYAPIERQLETAGKTEEARKVLAALLSGLLMTAPHGWVKLKDSAMLMPLVIGSIQDSPQDGFLQIDAELLLAAVGLGDKRHPVRPEAQGSTQFDTLWTWFVHGRELGFDLRQVQRVDQAEQRRQELRDSR